MIRLGHHGALGDVAADRHVDEGRLVAVALPGGLDAAPDLAGVADLHEGERSAAASMVPRRQRTYVGGRIALRRALVAVGAASRARDLDAIGTDGRGAPAVPPGFRGSIAHKDEVAVAMACADDGWALGVDVETSVTLAPGLARRILVPDELAQLDALAEADRGRELVRRFAAKEAIYKAIDPFLQRWVGFLEVCLWPGEGRYEVDPPGRHGEPRLVVEARAIDAGDVIIAVARARLV